MINCNEPFLLATSVIKYRGNNIFKHHQLTFLMVQWEITTQEPTVMPVLEGWFASTAVTSYEPTWLIVTGLEGVHIWNGNQASYNVCVGHEMNTSILTEYFSYDGGIIIWEQYQLAF